MTDEATDENDGEPSGLPDPEDLDPYAVQRGLVAKYGPPMGLDPKMLETKPRMFHTVKSMREAQGRGLTKALLVVPSPGFGEDRTDYVVDRLSSWEGADDNVGEAVRSFVDAGIMDQWSDRLRVERGWIERPLAILLAHVVTEPIREALEEAGANYLPRAASHVVFGRNKRHVLRVKSAISEHLEGAPVDVDSSRTRTEAVANILGEMSLDDGGGDRILEPEDEDVEVPDSLRRA